MKKPLKDRIITIMRKHDNTRDDWKYLLAMIWREEIGETNHSASAYAFLGMLAHKKVTCPENIRRTWQKILEEVPELRGPEYKHRHKISEPEFKKGLKELGQELKPQMGFFN